MYRVSEQVRSTHNPDGGTVLAIRDGQMFHLNLEGSRILELMKAGRQESEIVDSIRQEFSISEDIAQCDVREFIQILRDYRLVEERG